jgi:steroid 5-alpha reductase family enzyme
MRGPLRWIFPTSVLLMWMTLGFGTAAGTWTADHWVLLAIAAMSCSVIFYIFVDVFSYGYATSMVLLPAFVLLRAPTLAGLLVALPCMAYGVRLWTFVSARHGTPSYAPRRPENRAASAKMPIGLKVMIWLFVTTLMAFEAMPVWQAAGAGEVGAPLLAGVVMMVAGLLLETVADNQKQAAKLRDPAAILMTGLFRRSRHPNYLGEIVFQAGLLVAGLAGSGPWHVRLGAVLAPVYIVLLMWFAAGNMDAEQAKRAAADPAYARWRAGTGRLLPRLGGAG